MCIADKMMELLADGQRHTRKELIGCMGDDLSTPNAMRQHLYVVRERLESYGETLVCELVGLSIGYRWVKLIDPNEVKGRLTVLKQIKSRTQPNLSSRKRQPV